MCWSARANRNMFLFTEVDQKHESAWRVLHRLFFSSSVLVIKSPEKDNNMSALMVEKNQQDIIHMKIAIWTTEFLLKDISFLTQFS